MWSYEGSLLILHFRGKILCLICRTIFKRYPNWKHFKLDQLSSDLFQEHSLFLIQPHHVSIQMLRAICLGLSVKVHHSPELNLCQEIGILILSNISKF